MELDYNFLEKIERESYFVLTEAEKEKVKKELENMLSKFEILKNFDIGDIEPMTFNTKSLEEFNFIQDHHEDDIQAPKTLGQVN